MQGILQCTVDSFCRFCLRICIAGIMYRMYAEIQAGILQVSRPCLSRQHKQNDSAEHSRYISPEVFHKNLRKKEFYKIKRFSAIPHSILFYRITELGVFFAFSPGALSGCMLRLLQEVIF